MWCRNWSELARAVEHAAALFGEGGEKFVEAKNDPGISKSFPYWGACRSLWFLVTTLIVKDSIRSQPCTSEDLPEYVSPSLKLPLVYRPKLHVLVEEAWQGPVDQKHMNRQRNSISNGEMQLTRSHGAGSSGSRRFVAWGFPCVFCINIGSRLRISVHPIPFYAESGRYMAKQKCLLPLEATQTLKWESMF